MLIDCHLHTSRYSPCSILNPASACSLALKRGLNGLVITEHQLQWTVPEMRELQQEFPDLRLYTGLEVSLDEGFDVIVITQDSGLTFPFGISLEELLHALSTRRKESFLFLAHAFRWSGDRSDRMERVLDHMDGLEMNSVNIISHRLARNSERYPPRHSHLYEAILRERGLVPIYNSDAHSPQAVGSLATILNGAAPPADESELAALLKQSLPREYQNLQLLGGLNE